MKKTTVIYALVILYLVSILSSLAIIITKSTDSIKGKSSAAQSLSIMKKDAIAVINISGPISIATQSQRFLSNDSESVSHKIRQFSEKSDVKAILLRINSPGGSVAAVQEIYSEILRARKNGKIVVASFGDISASGGYYIACACDRIVANPGTLTGSIGVILQVGNVQELFKKIGVRMEIIKSGKFKDSGSPFRELTKEERDLFQSMIDDAYDQFVTAVADGRKLDRAAVLEIADGRVFTGKQALEKKMIDALGNDFDAIDLAKKISGIKGEPRIITESSSFEKLFSMIGDQKETLPIGEILSKHKMRFEYMFE